MLRERRRHANYKPNRRLDRKSSRGMIYENEELRLRTININAEVERGQSDIRKLRRENEQLRREIWSLRDEYDRLDKLLRANKSSDNCENECGNTSDGADLSQSEDSDSCDTCRGGDGDDDEDCPENYAAGRQQRGEGAATVLQDRIGGAGGKIGDPPQAWNDNSRGKFDDEPQYRQQARQTEIEENYENSQKSILEANAASDSVCVKKKNFNESAVASTSGTSSSLKLRDNLHVNFDHLSIVSEENLTNSSDGNSSVNHGDTTNLQQTPLPNDIPGSPQHTGLGQQSIVPPLSHFENIDYDQLGPNLESLDDNNYGTSSTTTGETVILANGWDFNVQQTLFGKVSSQSPTPQSQSVDMKGTSPNAIDYHEIRPPIYMAASFSGAANILPSGHGLESSASSLNATSNEMTTSTKSPKHFFSPIKPRLRINNDDQYNKNISQQRDEIIDNNGPDLYVTNALATPYSYAHASPSPQQQQHHQFDPMARKSSEPIVTSVQKAPRRACSPNAFQTGGNLEDLLMDIENLSKDILQMQLEKQKSYSQEKLTSIGDSNDNLCNNKPYRSEMNLVLTYNGSNPVITPIAKTTSSSSTTGLDMATNFFANCQISNNNFNNINSDMTDTPPPNLPEPMILFPQNLTYLGFEGYNSGVVAHPILGQQQQQQQQQHCAPSTIIGAMSIDPMQQYQPIVGASPFAEEYSNSPVPDDKSLPQEMTDVAASSSLTNIMLKSEGTPLLRKKILPPKLPSEDWPAEIGGAIGKEVEVINKSSIRSTPIDEIKKPLQATTFAATTGEKISRTESSASENANCDSSSGSEATKRKARRVSILFNGKKPSSTAIASISGASPKDHIDKSKIHKDNQSSQDYAKSTFRYKEKDMTASTGNLATSPTDLQQIVKNPCTSGAADTNNRTANSSHSFGQQQRRSSTTGGAGDGVHPSHHHHHHHHHHGHGHSHHHGPGIGGIGGTRKLSQDSSVRGLNLNKSTTSGQRKCSSRRHSDGTVLTTLSGSGAPGSHNQHQILGGIGGEQLGRQNLLSSSSAGQIRDSYQDGGGPGGTSMSERNSNSLPSSRESSASLSTKSSRRKLSASSHSGGKIPWCGCWGNGCL